MARFHADPGEHCYPEDFSLPEGLAAGIALTDRCGMTAEDRPISPTGMTLLSHALGIATLSPSMVVTSGRRCMACFGPTSPG